MLECPNCKSQTQRLVIKDGIKCPNCHVKDNDSSPSYLHMSAGNKHMPSMSQALENHIKDRRLDGGQVKFSHKRFESRYIR